MVEKADKIQALKARFEKLRAERDSHPVESREWLSLDGLIFEARCELRQAQAVQRLAGRSWQCSDCGTMYDASWVAVVGHRCHAECDGELVLVEAPGRRRRLW